MRGEALIHPIPPSQDPPRDQSHNAPEPSKQRESRSVPAPVSYRELKRRKKKRGRLCSYPLILGRWQREIQDFHDFRGSVRKRKDISQSEAKAQLSISVTQSIKCAFKGLSFMKGLSEWSVGVCSDVISRICSSLMSDGYISD